MCSTFPGRLVLVAERCEVSSDDESGGEENDCAGMRQRGPLGREPAGCCTAAGGHGQCSRQDPSHKPSLPLQIEYVTSETLLMELTGMNPASA